MKKLSRRFETVPLSELPKDIVPIETKKFSTPMAHSKRMLPRKLRGQVARKASSKAGE